MTPPKTWAPWEYEPTPDLQKLGVSQADFDDAMARARAACADIYSLYGFQVWLQLVVAKRAFIVAVEQLVDRLPATAFGQPGPQGFTMAALEWSRYKAPNEWMSILAFKGKALEAGWRPSMVNSYFVTLRPMERGMLGPWKPGEKDPMIGLETPEGMNQRHTLVYESMKQQPAFA